MSRALAPGKVVLWGEYAVLTGAPALVAAVDRFAACNLEPGGHRWLCSVAGYRADTPELTRDALVSTEPPPGDSAWRMFWHVLQALPADALPSGGQAAFDTADFHHHGSKLGLGSSAALCVAVYAATCRLLQRPADHNEAQRIHRSLQNGAGSGIDVAAAWQGGLLRFQRSGEGVGEARAWELPPDLHTVFVWSGAAASPTAYLKLLQTWRNQGGGGELTELAVQRTVRNQRPHGWPRPLRGGPGAARPGGRTRRVQCPASTSRAACLDGRGGLQTLRRRWRRHRCGIYHGLRRG